MPLVGMLRRCNPYDTLESKVCWEVSGCVVGGAHAKVLYGCQMIKARQQRKENRILELESEVPKMRSDYVLEQGGGILRLAPTWVPRAFGKPGRRLKLHPDDYYALGLDRGPFVERWIASTVPASNGPGAPSDEGLSYVVSSDDSGSDRTTLAIMIEELGADLVGDSLWNNYGRMPAYTKFFDYQGALPFHLHLMQKHAELVGNVGKPEVYYFPPQMNNHAGDFPHTYFGLNPSVTREDIRKCLEQWEQGDNLITNFSRAYRLHIGTGWDIPPGILHAPGSFCTYEPQWFSDQLAMFQSVVAGEVIDRSLLTKDVPEHCHYDYDFLVDTIDWQANQNAYFKEKHFRLPKSVSPIGEMEEDGFREFWVAYGNQQIAAKELTVLPGRNCRITDAGPYGVIVVQGHGRMGPWAVESPAMIRFGELTNDEFFVSARAASEGVEIVNDSLSTPLVILKNFGPNEEAPGHEY